MRIYVAVDAELLRQLAAGERVSAPAFRAETEDEEDEAAALEDAAEHGCVVVAADVDGTDDVTLEDVAALHVDLDGTGDLAWFATQEIDAVLRIVQEH
ncbi:hypothetical protein GCM10022234_06100 [Aeromicrobium panaciterrae]|uniref:hypothetical protein n=1 Tax=Aeromicrobium panaciterrae TaxID=363861 RepID=UPI0031D86B7D